MGRKSNIVRQHTFRDILEDIRNSANATKQQKLPHYYIITEGQTEKWYLIHLRNADKLKFTFPDPISVNGGDYLTKIAEEIDKQSAIPRSKIICIFDVDRFHNSQAEFVNYQKFVEKYKVVNIFNNMPSVEYWFLLHFMSKPISKFFSKTELLGELTKFKPFENKSEQELKSDTFLAQVNWFNVLCGNSFVNLTKAINFAKIIARTTSNNRMDKVKAPTGCSVSYSDMYKLFDLK